MSQNLCKALAEISQSVPSPWLLLALAVASYARLTLVLGRRVWFLRPAGMPCFCSGLGRTIENRAIIVKSQLLLLNNCKQTNYTHFMLLIVSSMWTTVSKSNQFLQCPQKTLQFLLISASAQFKLRRVASCIQVVLESIGDLFQKSGELL
jgi:hypothetical protein